MNRLFWLLVSGCLWAVMMYLLFDREILPYFEYQQPPSYRTLLRGRKDAEIQFRRIRLGTQNIGEAESVTDPLPTGGYAMTTRLTMRMQPLTGMTLPDDRVYMSSTVRVDPLYQLTQFTIDGRMLGGRMKVQGERVGERLRVEYDLILFKGDRFLDFPRDATLADNFIPYAGGAKLTEGKKWRMRLLDFDNIVSPKPNEELSFTEVYAVVVGREILDLDGKTAPTFRVEVRKNPSDPAPAYTLWVDDAGTVLQQTMKINKLLCTVVLEDHRRVAAEEVRAYDWRVTPPK